jgi:hypothetical protein
MSYLESMNYGGQYPSPAMQNQYGGAIAGGAGAAQQQQMAGAGGMQSPALTGWQKFGYVMDGIGAIGGLWGAIQQNKIAKQQLALSKEAYNTNMNNTIKTYNTALEDRIRARYTMEGRSDQADAYIDENKLTRDKSGA